MTVATPPTTSNRLIRLPEEDEPYPVAVRLPRRLRMRLARVFRALADRNRATGRQAPGSGQPASGRFGLPWEVDDPDPQPVVSLLKRLDMALQKQRGGAKRNAVM